MILSTRKSPPKNIGKAKRAKTASKKDSGQSTARKDAGTSKPAYKEALNK